MAGLWILFNPDKYLSGITESLISTEHTPAVSDAQKDGIEINNRCMSSERTNSTFIFGSVFFGNALSLFRRHFLLSPFDFLLGIGRKCEIQMWIGRCRCAPFKAKKHKSARPVHVCCFQEREPELSGSEQKAEKKGVGLD